jgi:Putative Ig domain
MAQVLSLVSQARIIGMLGLVLLLVFSFQEAVATITGDAGTALQVPDNSFSIIPASTSHNIDFVGASKIEYAGDGVTMYVGYGAPSQSLLRVRRSLTVGDYPCTSADSDECIITVQELTQSDIDSSLAGITFISDLKVSTDGKFLYVIAALTAFPASFVRNSVLLTFEIDATTSTLTYKSFERATSDAPIGALIALSPDGTMIVTVGSKVGTVTAANNFRSTTYLYLFTRDATTGAATYVTSLDESVHTNPTTTIAATHIMFSPDSSYVYVGTVGYFDVDSTVTARSPYLLTIGVTTSSLTHVQHMELPAQSFYMYDAFNLKNVARVRFGPSLFFSPDDLQVYFQYTVAHIAANNDNVDRDVTSAAGSASTFSMFKASRNAGSGLVGSFSSVFQSEYINFYPQAPVFANKLFVITTAERSESNGERGRIFRIHAWNSSQLVRVAEYTSFTANIEAPVKAITCSSMTCAFLQPDAPAMSRGVFLDQYPMQVSLSQDSVTLTKGQAITAIVPSFSTRIPVSVHAFPNLPDGLSFVIAPGAAVGTIAGTPTEVVPTTDYRIEFSDLQDSVAVVLRMQVNDIAPSGLSYAVAVNFTEAVALPGSFSPTVGGGSVVLYTADPILPAGIVLDSSSGTISGTPAVSVMYTDYTITATNSGGSTFTVVRFAVLSASPPAVILVPPKISYASAEQTFTLGDVIAIAVDASAGGTATSFVVSPTLPGGIELNTVTGAITGTAVAIVEKTTYIVTASNSDGSSATSITLTVNDEAPTISYASSPLSLTQNSAMSTAAASRSGGTFTSISVNPALPPGLALSLTTGAITGTPLIASGSQSFVVTVSNSGGSNSATIAITVAAASLPPGSGTVSYTQSTVILLKNAAMVPLIPSLGNNGADATFSVSPSLPAGLVLDTDSGVVSGTPSALSSATGYTITATNNVDTPTTTITITVTTDPLIQFSPNTVALNYDGQSAGLDSDIVPTNSGGTVLRWAIYPDLPGSLTFSTSTGVISGFADSVSASTRYMVSAFGAGGSVATAELNLQVIDIPPTGLSYSVPAPIYTVGTVAADNIPTVLGGELSLSFSISPSLPDGLVFNSSFGQISGTPRVATKRAQTFVITVSNTGGSASVLLDIQVNAAATVAAPDITYASNVISATNKTAVSNSMSNSGGEPDSLTVIPSLPLGLQLDTSTGLISGVAQQVYASTTHFVVASNTAGQSYFQITITITDTIVQSLSYNSDNPILLQINSAISPAILPSVDGTVTSFQASPTLPVGIILDSSTGVISGTPLELVDATFVISARNSGGTLGASIRITVTQAAIASISYANTAANYTIGHIIAPNAVTVVGGTPTLFAVSGTALPAGLSLNAQTGTISGTPTALSVQDTATVVTIVATHASSSKSTTVSIIIVDRIPALVYESPRVYALDQAITSNTPANTGGAIVHATIEPALPVGLLFSAQTGVISGTPTELSSTQAYRVIATSTGGSSIAVVLIAVDAAPTSLSYDFSTAVYVLGEAITPNHPITSGGGLATAYSTSPTLPAGLRISALTGIITGTPTVAIAQTEFTVTAENGQGSETTDLKIMVLNVTAPKFAYQDVVSKYLINAPINANVVLLESNGGTITSFIVSPPLPAGLNLDSSTGAISGTPTVASAATTYLVTASNSRFATTVAISMTVAASLNHPNFEYSSSLSQYSRNVAIADNTVVVAQGSGPIDSYSISPPLPPGLTFNTVSGAISGTPTAAASQGTYLITASNSLFSSTVAISITIVESLNAPDFEYSANVGQYPRTVAITDNTVTVAPGSGPIASYRVSPPLPVGLSLNTASGTISGTPTGAASQGTYLITASNALLSSTVAISITIVDSLNAPDFMYKNATNQYRRSVAIADNTVVVAQGSGPIVSYRVSPPLPVGLSLNTASGTISGTPTAAASQGTYLITASNSLFSSIVAISIAVSDDLSAPSISLVSETFNLRNGTAAPSTIVPTNTGGAAIRFSIFPALPTGLTFNKATGQISGTPIEADPFGTSYQISAFNSVGQSEFIVRIKIAQDPAAATSGGLLPAEREKLESAATETEVNTAVTYSLGAALLAFIVLIVLVIIAVLLRRVSKRVDSEGDIEPGASRRAAALPVGSSSSRADGLNESGYDIISPTAALMQQQQLHQQMQQQILTLQQQLNHQAAQALHNQQVNDHKTPKPLSPRRGGEHHAFDADEYGDDSYDAVTPIPAMRRPSSASSRLNRHRRNGSGASASGDQQLVSGMVRSSSEQSVELAALGQGSTSVSEDDRHISTLMDPMSRASRSQSQADPQPDKRRTSSEFETLREQQESQALAERLAQVRREREALQQQMADLVGDAEDDDEEEDER